MANKYLVEVVVNGKVKFVKVEIAFSAEEAKKMVEVTAHTLDSNAVVVEVYRAC